MEDGQGSLKGTLIAEQSITVSNWRNSGFDLEIMVREINTNASPGYADVEITFGPQAMLDLMIKVNEIDTDVTPSYASVEITFGPEN